MIPTEQTTQTAVAFFIKHLPSHLRLILVTRADPPLPFPAGEVGLLSLVARRSGRFPADSLHKIQRQRRHRLPLLVNRHHVRRVSHPDQLFHP